MLIIKEISDLTRNTRAGQKKLMDWEEEPRALKVAKSEAGSQARFAWSRYLPTQQKFRGSRIVAVKEVKEVVLQSLSIANY